MVRAAGLKIKLNQHTEALADFESLLSQINPGSWLHQDIRRRIDESFQTRQDTVGLTAYYKSWIEKHPDDIDAMMRIGRLLSIARNSAAAKEWFSRAIERAPSAVEPRLALVEALERDGQTSAAVKAMQSLSEIQPGNIDYLVRWGELVRNDYSLPEAGRNAAAADIWRKLLDKNNDNPVMVSRVADLIRSANLSDEAIKLYTRAVELADAEPQYREYLGEYLHRLGRNEEAMKVWRDLASGPRRNRDNLVRLSEVLTTFGFKPEALAVMGEACQMQPTFGHRLRYSEKLVEATQYSEALAQLELASKQAANDEEQDQVLEQEIKVYLGSGDIAKRIEALEAEVAQPAAAKSAAAWKRFALYQEADGKTQQAHNAIQEAVKLAPQSVGLLNIAARIQEKAGLMGDAVTTLRKLIALDRRGQSRILMQVAAMHVRIGQIDQAIKAAQEMLAASDAGIEQYRYYADLCFQAGKVDQGLDALRRNMRANPNNREAIDLLARALSNNFKTDEAIELTWRSFAKASNMSEKTQNVQSLTELYLRSNGFDDLIKRLEAYGREENRAREATILTATAQQASGDLAAARQLLEPLLTADSRDSELLTTLIDLARADGDWDAAANYQTKLNNLSPTPEGGLQLAKFLLEKGDIEQAESIWNKYATQKMSADDMQNNMRQLLLSGETDKVIGLIERALKNSPDDWEVLAVCMQMYYRCEKDAEAKALAAKLLEMKVPGDTLSENSQRQRSRQAANPQSTASTPPRTNVFGLPASANNTSTDRMSCMSRAMQVVQMLTLERSNPAVAVRQMGFGSQSLVCYRDARFMALYFNQSGTQAKPEDTEGLPTAVQKESNVDKLWEMAFLSNFRASPGTARGRVPSLAGMATGVIYSSLSGTQFITGSTNLSMGSSNMTPILKRLAELEDQQAQLWLVGEALRELGSMQLSRQPGSSIQINPATGQPMIVNGVAPQAKIESKTLDEYLALLNKVRAQPTNASNDQVLLLSIYLAGELKKFGRQEDSQQLLDYFKQNSRATPKMSYATALVRLDLDLAIDTFLLAMKQMPPPTGAPMSTVAIFNSPNSMDASNFLTDVLDQSKAVAGLETESASANINRANPLRLITELKKLQAERARRMRPSQLSSYTPSNPVRYMVRNSARSGSVGIIPFPAPSALQSSELLLAMFLVQQYPNNLYRDELDKLLRAEAAQADDDAMQSAVDHLCLSIWLWWGGEKEEALKEMEVVRQTATVNDLASMLAMRMYYESGRMKEALAQLESLKPTTAQLMQERELAILQLASQTDNKDLAKQAAERLFAMRLPSQTQMQVANQMQQLGMSEMASSMMQRLQRRGGNQITTLVQMMTQFRSENKTSSAQEIARQILRRTRSSRGTATSAARSVNDTYRRQALQVLAGSAEIKDQIKELEEKVKANPKSTNLAYQLAELYEATGRAQDSASLLAKLQPTSKAAAQSSIAARLNAFRQTRDSTSVQGYLEIFEKNPEYIDREFPYFQMAVQQHRGWDTVAKAMSQWPKERLVSTNANFDSLLQMTFQQASEDSADKLMKKLLESDEFAPRFAGLFAIQAKKPKWSDETRALLDERVCKALSDLKLNVPVQSAYGGQVIGSLSAVNHLMTTPESAKKVLATTAPLSDKHPQMKCLEVLMQLTAGDQPAAEKTLEQVRALPVKENMALQWELASELVNEGRHSLAIPLLLQVVNFDTTPASPDFGSKALLLVCYGATQNHEQAKQILDECWEVLQKQTSLAGDPGAAQTVIQNASRIAEQYNQAGYRLEAFAVVTWVKNKPDLLTNLARMYGGGRVPQQESLNQLEQKIKDKMDGKTIGQLLRRELQSNQTAAAASKSMTLPVAMLVPDIRAMAEQNATATIQLRELMSRLNEDATEKASLKQLLIDLSKNGWSDMAPRALVASLYLADYLQESDTYIAIARILNERLVTPDSEGSSSAKEKEVQTSKALQPAYWLIAEKLIERGQPELAQAMAKHAASKEEPAKLESLHMQLRMARSLKDAKQQPAAEAQMRDLLNRLYPAKTNESK